LNFFLFFTRKILIDGCLIGNPCGIGTCVSGSMTAYSCACPAGYGGNKCDGLNFFYLLLLFVFFAFQKKKKKKK